MTASLDEELAAEPGNAHERLSGLKSTDAGDRALALGAAATLVDRYIRPASDLLSADPDEPDYTAYDLDAIAGTDLPGLSLGVLARRLPSLTISPADEEFAAILDELGLEVDDQTKRSAFLRAWKAQRAAYVIRELVGLLKDIHPGTAADDAAEVQSMHALAPTLPGFERRLVEAILDRRKILGASTAGLERLSPDH